MSDADVATDPVPTADRGQPAVVVEGLSKHFEGGRTRALDGVDLVVENGEFVAITGPSGCGKSTLLHLIAALDSPTMGTVTVRGRNLHHLRGAARFRRTEIGLVFQLHNLLPHMTATQNVEIAMFGTRTSIAERRARSAELLEEVQLGGRGGRKPPLLSGGERQRIAIARALANRPGLLLADEPTGSLDSASVDHTLDLFRRLRVNEGITIMLVTHDLRVAAAADRIVHMCDGRIVDATS